MTIRAKLKKPQLPTSFDDGVGSVVLKGFTVPSGFVLHYKTSTGAEKSAREGEHVNASHKFQDVRSGKVPGWSLQKVQSDFSFEAEDEETTLEFEDHTFTPWGDKATVLGVPVIPDATLRKMNTVLGLGGIGAKYNHPEITQYIAEIRATLEDMYKVKPGLSEQDVLDTIQLVNRNIGLLLALEKTPYIQKLFDISNPPDVTSPNLEDELSPRNAERVNLDNLSPMLLKQLYTMAGKTAEEFVKEVSGEGMTRKDFEEKYGQYVRINSVKINKLLVTKEEAQDLIHESLRGIPEEVRPIVITYLGGQDLVNQSIDEVIAALKEADYFFTDTMTADDLESLQPKEELSLYDLRKIKVEGYDFIPGRFEILKRILSMNTLIDLMTSTPDDKSVQSVRDMVSEIIENYVEYLGGEIHIYKRMMKDWLGTTSGPYSQALMDWAAGKNSPEVKEIRPTLEAVQAAHSAIYESVSEGELYRPVEITLDSDVFNITELSVETLSPFVSFTLDRERAEKEVEGKGADRVTKIILTAQVPPSKVQFIPGLYMPTSYWKTVKGKPVYVNRESVRGDENVEVVVKTSSIIITDYEKTDEHEVLKVVV